MSILASYHCYEVGTNHPGFLEIERVPEPEDFSFKLGVCLGKLGCVGHLGCEDQIRQGLWKTFNIVYCLDFDQAPVDWS